MLRRADVARFIVQTPIRSNKRSFTLDTDETQHAVSVLRVREGQTVEICDGQGGSAAALVDAFNRRQRELTVEDHSVSLAEVKMQVTLSGDPVFAPKPQPEVVLCVACKSLKGGRGDWLVEKATELGASALVPLLCERSPVHIRQGLGKGDKNRRERWKRVSLAAMKQCLRIHAMTIEAPQTMDELQHGLSNHSLQILATSGGQPVTTLPLQRSLRESERVALFVGPEGDFTEPEKAQLIQEGAVSVSLGDRRLRVETAALALLSFVQLSLPSE